MRFNRLQKTVALLGLSFTIALTGVPLLPGAEVPTAHAYSASKASDIIATGNRYLHTPYDFGAPSGTTRVFDCSSFTQYVYKRNGISLPRSSRQQVREGRYVSKSNLRKGDLVFFSTPSSQGRIGHVAIYAGNGRILHTYGKPGVTYSNLNSDWWKSHYITARRVIR